uniref:rhoGEF domain-containing protein gxcI-like isoform X2 n=1 Tax=Vespula vulgaris TaxID=7454 RepID=UPI00213C2E32|nr:rhoGEF domain-containing protein gxcI-like isoform X2 [Vespula vulgaris]
MSPRLRKYRVMDTSVIITRKRSKILNSINKNSNSLQDTKQNIENQKKSKANVSVIKDKRVKHKKSLNIQFSKKNMQSERPKKNNTSNKFTMIKNPIPKANKVIYDDIVSDGDNTSCELINDSFINLNINNEQKSKYDISLNETITPKSSPISITLTPQRTTKTPRKSPLPLTSPKTHSEIPLRISKTPRKLMLSVNSATKLNNCEISLRNRKSINNSLLNNVSMNNVKIRLNKLKTSYISTENLTRLSKSSNMMLKSPDTKSKSLKMKSNEKGEKFIVTTVKESPNENISTKSSTRSKKDSTNKLNKSSNNSKNNTININDKEIKADETYELLEPKTPHLQRQCRKRRAVELDTNDKRDVKRACKVRFAASESRINKSQTTLLESKSTKLNTSISLCKTKHVSNITVRKTPVIRHISHMRSSSVSNALANKTISDSEFKRRSSSMSNINRTLYNNSRKMDKTLSSTLNKTKHIGSQEKKDVKIHSAKKIPNFSEIHKKLFSKMESLVDNKNRLIKQHEALKTFNVSRLETKNIKKPLPTEIKRDGYTKFGFKIRKADATNIILRKQQINRQKEKREENRVLLRGVRTNRRFELQMKMRKLSD